MSKLLPTHPPLLITVVSLRTLDVSITTEVEHHDFDESDYISQELCEEEVQPTNLELVDDILSMEY